MENQKLGYDKEQVYFSDARLLGKTRMPTGRKCCRIPVWYRPALPGRCPVMLYDGTQVYPVNEKVMARRFT
jgi:hypothetical protein